jgi:hypothetical protein
MVTETTPPPQGPAGAAFRAGNPGCHLRAAGRRQRRRLTHRRGGRRRLWLAKTTIYRNWRDKWILALDAVMIDMLPDLDGRSTSATLAANCSHSTTRWSGCLPRHRSAQPCDTWSPRPNRPRPRARLPRTSRPVPPGPTRSGDQRGSTRGDLRTDTEVRLDHELLAGPVIYRLPFSGAPSTAASAPASPTLSSPASPHVATARGDHATEATRGPGSRGRAETGRATTCP